MFSSRLSQQVNRLLFNSRNAMAFKNTAMPVSQFKTYSTNVQVVEEQEQQVEDQESINRRIGIDTTFSEQKHAYVLTFPWNFPEIISQYEHQVLSGGYWPMFVENSKSTVDFNNLFREFHQQVSLPHFDNIRQICEGRLAQVVNQSVERIHFHGLDIEMANLTVEQPSIQVLKAELSHGINVERDSNGSLSDYKVTDSSILGAPCKYFVRNDSTRDCIDNLEDDYRPYVLSVTCLIESPMKLFVQNQNYSKILFGSDDGENVKNVVKFEANIKWNDLFRVLPTNNKRSLNWKITDINNIMNENPYF